jgi:hypothetical protein
MNYEEMQEIQGRLFNRIRSVRETKGREYATDEDTLADFKEVAQEVGVTPFQVWAVYVKKHQRAIDTFIREGATKSESIEDRVMDVMTYHALLIGLVEDLQFPSDVRVAVVDQLVPAEDVQGFSNPGFWECTGPIGDMHAVFRVKKGETCSICRRDERQVA